MESRTHSSLKSCEFHAKKMKQIPNFSIWRKWHFMKQISEMKQNLVFCQKWWFIVPTVSKSSNWVACTESCGLCGYGDVCDMSFWYIVDHFFGFLQMKQITLKQKKRHVLDNGHNFEPRRNWEYPLRSLWCWKGADSNPVIFKEYKNRNFEKSMFEISVSLQPKICFKIDVQK